MNVATHKVSSTLAQTVPARSPRSSIVLAEAVRRRREARRRRREARKLERKSPSLLQRLSQLFDSAPFDAVALRKRPEMLPTVTGAGPLVRS
jgi:hypothetical protein